MSRAAAFRPTWSPDSSTVAFMTTIGLDGGDLQTVDPSTGIVTAPDPTVWVSSYSWARDSKSLVYVSGTNDVSPVDIGVLDLETLSNADVGRRHRGVRRRHCVAHGRRGDLRELEPAAAARGRWRLRAREARPLLARRSPGGEPTTVAPDPDPDDYRWGVRDSAGCLWYARQFAEGTGQVLLHRLCAGDPEPASPVTDLTLFPAVPAVAGSNAIAYMVEGEEHSLFVLDKPDGDPIHIDDGVTAFGWVQ